MSGVTYILPRTKLDRIAFGIFCFGSLLCIWYETFVVIPHYNPDSNSYGAVLNYALVIFFSVNILGNFFKLLQVNSTTAGIILPPIITPEMQASGWSYCYFCQLNFPPRAYHCVLCKQCVLRRDTHCFFAGKCAGHSNQRYFVFLVIYCWLAAIYYNLYNLDFVHSVLGISFDILTIVSLLAPHVGLLLKKFSLVGFGVTLLTHIGLFAFVALSVVIVPLLLRIRSGQTAYERKKSDRSYVLGHSLKDNLIEVFGSNYVIAALFPFASSPLPSDGLSYNRRLPNSGVIKEL